MAKTIIGRRAKSPLSRAPAAPATPAPEPEPTLISLDGLMSYNTCVHSPMAIINPKASLSDMLSWADGQLGQLHTLIDSIGGTTASDQDNAKLGTAINHFIQPVCAVLQEAAIRAHRTELALARAQQPPGKSSRGKRPAPSQTSS